MTIRTVEDKTEDEINLNRVIYLLQYGSLENNAMFLLNYAYTVSKATFLPKGQWICGPTICILIDKCIYTAFIHIKTADSHQFLHCIQASITVLKRNLDWTKLNVKLAQLSVKTM